MVGFNEILEVLRVAAAVIGFAAALPGPGAAGSAPPATLQDVAWMAGHWTGQVEGGLSDEVWAAPQGDSMMGMWRLLVGGKTKLFELLTITQEDDGPTLRLRHFDPKLVSREEKDRPFVLKLTSHAPGEVVFFGKETQGLLRLTYRKLGDSQLSVLLERGDSKEEFRFRRASP
jgi:hypothetical protein